MDGIAALAKLPYEALVIVSTHLFETRWKGHFESERMKDAHR